MIQILRKEELVEKVKIENGTYALPMPVVLVGAVVENKPNFMAVGWVTRVHLNPPMIAVSLRKTHYTNEGIIQKKTFSVNIPGVELAEKVDYCGIFSGRKADKSQIFEVFYGELPTAPMVRECPICMERMKGLILKISGLPSVRYRSSVYNPTISPMKRLLLGRSTAWTSLHSMHMGHSRTMGAVGSSP
jgi:hypothetical protein